MMIDSVPPEHIVPQCFPDSSFSPIKSAVMATTYIYICFTRGKSSA